MLNHLHAFRAGANSELIHPLVPLQLRSSFKWTHKSFCVYVSAHGNASSQLPILRLNAEHPRGDGFGSLQNGKSIFAVGVIGGLRGEKFLCWEGRICMCDFSEGKVLHNFSPSLCFCCALGRHEWLDIYKRQQVVERVMLMSACRRCNLTKKNHSLLKFPFLNCTPHHMCPSYI